MNLDFELEFNLGLDFNFRLVLDFWLGFSGVDHYLGFFLLLFSLLPQAILLGQSFWIWFLSDEGPMLETSDYTIRIGSTPTILYFDLSNLVQY